MRKTETQKTTKNKHFQELFKLFIYMTAGLEIITSAVREACVSGHDEGPIEDTPLVR